MTEKKVRVKIRSRISDLAMANMAEEYVGAEIASAAADVGDIIEYSTDGVIREKGKNLELSYEECSEMGMDNTVTTLIFPKNEPNELNMVRTGDNTAGLVFSGTNKRQPCSYNVGGYPFEFCIYTRSIDNKVSMKGGCLELDYVIEMRGVKTQRNRFTIKVDELRN